MGGGSSKIYVVTTDEPAKIKFPHNNRYVCWDSWSAVYNICLLTSTAHFVCTPKCASHVFVPQLVLEIL